MLSFQFVVCKKSKKKNRIFYVRIHIHYDKRICVIRSDVVGRPHAHTSRFNYVNNKHWMRICWSIEVIAFISLFRFVFASVSLHSTYVQHTYICVMCIYISTHIRRYRKPIIICIYIIWRVTFTYSENQKYSVYCVSCDFVCWRKNIVRIAGSAGKEEKVEDNTDMASFLCNI